MRYNPINNTVTIEKIANGYVVSCSAPEISGGINLQNTLKNLFPMDKAAPGEDKPVLQTDLFTVFVPTLEEAIEKIKYLEKPVK